MFQVGDVIQYEASRKQNDIPGFVVGIVYDRRGNRDCLEVQWFDWEPGEPHREDAFTVDWCYLTPRGTAHSFEMGYCLRIASSVSEAQ